MTLDAATILAILQGLSTVAQLFDKLLSADAVRKAIAEARANGDEIGAGALEKAIVDMAAAGARVDAKLRAAGQE